MQTTYLRAKGTHCPSCAVVISQELQKVSGVKNVQVNYHTGKVVVQHDGVISLSSARDALKKFGYELGESDDEEVDHPVLDRTNLFYAIFLVAGALIVMRFLYNGIGVGATGQLSIVFALFLGLIASVSTCMAVTGSLLLGLSVEFTQRFPNVNGLAQFKPHIYFNIGRVASYVAFGTVIGALGKTIGINVVANGVITVAVGVVLCYLGVTMLGILRPVRVHGRLFAWGERLKNNINPTSKLAPLLLGATTFFLPCGFTQALQLYILTLGDPLQGGLLMGVFALGTVPGLVAIGAVASFVTGTMRRYFLKVAGALIVATAIISLGNGLSLFGFTWYGGSSGGVEAVDRNVRVVDGKQIVSMEVNKFGRYSPNKFTISSALPVVWEIDVKNPYACSSVITIPRYQLVRRLVLGKNTIEFTPREKGSLPFMCSMGMFRGEFIVQ